MYRLVDSYNAITKRYTLRDQSIPQQDFVADPDTQETYHIAVIKRELPNGTYEFEDVTFLAQQLCIIRLNLKHAKDLEKFRFMEITNYNTSNPNRDRNYTPYFERISASTDYDFSRAHRKLVKQAFAIIDLMSEDDIKSFIRATPQIVVKSDDAETRLNAIEEFAELYPQTIIGASTVGLADFEAEIDQLIDSKVVNYDKGATTWHLKSGEPVFKLSKTFASQPKQALSKFLFKDDAMLAKVRKAATDSDEIKTTDLVGTPAPKKPR